MVKKWCGVIVLMLASLTVSCVDRPESAFNVAWGQYKSRFYENGRIANTANVGMSWSAAQGYGMLFAVAADDQTQFEDMWLWTKTHLQRADKLFNKQCQSVTKPCTDNFHTDTVGDVMIAWALLKGANKWNELTYRAEALSIIQSLSSQRLLNFENNTLLLSGEEDIVFANGDVQVSLSNWIFPALHAFSESSGDETWDEVAISGIALIAKSQSQWQVVPEWLRITKQGISLEGVISPVFGSHVYCVPLFLAWQGVDRRLITPFVSYWGDEQAPASYNLLTHQKGRESLTDGMLSVMSTVDMLYGSANATQVSATNSLGLRDDMGYVSSSMVLLSLLALNEGVRQ